MRASKGTTKKASQDLPSGSDEQKRAGSNVPGIPPAAVSALIYGPGLMTIHMPDSIQRSMTGWIALKYSKSTTPSEGFESPQWR
jgi:hypothetical protein